MCVTSCFRLFLIVLLLFLSFGCRSVNAPKPERTDSVLDKNSPNTKKLPDKKSDVSTSKTRKKHHQKAAPKSAPKSAPRPMIYETGKASFYADKFQSRRTASGEIFDQRAKTAAHRRLPFGTRVKVTNKRNKKSVIVTINDRGPFVKSRIIDLSKSAFQRIGSTRHGILDVELQIIGQNDPGLSD